MIGHGRIEAAGDHLESVPQSLARDASLVEHRPGVVVTVCDGREVAKLLADPRPGEVAECGLALPFPADGSHDACLELLGFLWRAVAGDLFQGGLRWLTLGQRIAGEHVERGHMGEEFPLECPACGGDIRLIALRLLSECETIPSLRTRGHLRLLRTSRPRAGADPENPHAS